MQHIMVYTDGVVNPEMADVWRDDQTIMWILGPNLAWPPGVQQPIQFLSPPDPPDPEVDYREWPGTQPAPIGAPPGPEEADTRPYVALANQLNGTGEPFAYRYAIPQVVNLLTLQKHRVRVGRRRTAAGPLEWFDPDIGNQPYP